MNSAGTELEKKFTLAKNSEYQYTYLLTFSFIKAAAAEQIVYCLTVVFFSDLIHI